MVDQLTATVFCQPSCDLNNGGCFANHECSLVYPSCIPGPGGLCIPEVKCTCLSKYSYSYKYACNIIIGMYTYSSLLNILT